MSRRYDRRSRDARWSACQCGIARSFRSSSCICPLFFLFIIGSLLFQRNHSPFRPSALPVIIVAALTTGALTYLCFKAASALRRARRWAAYVAIAWGLLFLALGGLWIFGLYHPHRESPDEYFDIVFVPPVIAVGVWWCVYLNLPHVKANLRPHAGRSSQA